MQFDLIIRNGRIVTAEGVIETSVAINGGTIVEMGEITGGAKEEIDAGGLHVFPGVIDPHVHFNEPGRTEWEGFATGSAALAAGGGTCFFDMPLNSSPPVLDGESFDLKLAAAKAFSCTDFALWGGLTPTNLDKLEELAARGVIGFKAFMSNSGIQDFQAVDDAVLLEGMKIAAKLGLIVAVHAESEAMTSALTAEFRSRNVPGTWADYAATRPIAAEVEAIEHAIANARATGCRLHVVHVSNSAGAHAVHAARQQGVDVTCETCPHYLAMTIHDLEGLGARAKCAPPLRSPAEAAGLWDDLADGLFCFVGSDHSPAPGSMKTGDDPFAIWGGIAGVQSTLPILLSRSLPLPLVASLLSAGAADRFGIFQKGKIAVGYDADFAMVDLNDSFQLTSEMLLDRHKLSPYVGRFFSGVVKRTIVRGNTVLADGKRVGDFRGRLIKGLVMVEQIVRGPLLIPGEDGSVVYHPDGVLVGDSQGVIQFAGAVDALRDTGLWPLLEDARTGQRPGSRHGVRVSDGIILPPFVDIHIHIPQHPIRGRFVEGVSENAPEGKLLAGLNRNVFPAEAGCFDADYAEHVVRAFLADTISHGVVGGAAYMTPSAVATEIALSILPDTWSVGLVLMDQNCPENLRTDRANLEVDFKRLARRFGRRLIVTDRFAVAVDTPLRKQASVLALQLGLRTQTHLNEQIAEKRFVENVLYPGSVSYTDVYLQDGLLESNCIAAHCIHMRDEEWSILRDTGSVIAHCPTSNVLLGSGVMQLDKVVRRKIPYALGTDVGASPTVSMLAEMGRFVRVHAGSSSHATGVEALYRATRAPADLLGLSSGKLESGQPMSFIEVGVSPAAALLGRGGGSIAFA